MATDLEKIAAIQDILEKNAFIGSVVGAAGRGAFRAGKGVGTWAIRNPGKALGGVGLTAAFGVLDVSDAMKGSNQNIAQNRAAAAQIKTEPTF